MSGLTHGGIVPIVCSMIPVGSGARWLAMEVCDGLQEQEEESEEEEITLFGAERKRIRNATCE